MGSISRRTRTKATVTKPLPSKVTTIEIPKAPVVKKYDSLEKGFKANNLKCKRVGDDWRFSTGSTLKVDVKPSVDDLKTVVDYMCSHTGTGVNVNISSILRGCK